MLPMAGEVLVRVGDSVSALDIIARSFLPGDVIPINVANLLSLPPGDVKECMLVAEGQQVEVDQPLARTKGIFGMFKSECKSKAAGTIESISPVTGQVMIRGERQPIQLCAFLTGEVIDVIDTEGAVIEADVTFIQGIFGVGGEAFGPLRVACPDHEQQLTVDLIHQDMSGAVIVGGARVTEEAIRRAIDVGAAAIVTGGIDDSDLHQFLGYDLGVAITGAEQLGLTLIITEGFGDIAMARQTFALLSSREGDQAAVNGATQIRAGVKRPEVVIPLAGVEAETSAPEHRVAGGLEVGTPIRIIRDPYFGLIGEVAELPSEPQVLDSGSKARVLEVRFESGRSAVVPRANVELIED